ncbi:MAG: DUF456 family protein [Wenzhouxiangellaceae bacterium]
MEAVFGDVLMIGGWLAAIVLILLGLIGAVVPALPGTPLVLAGLVLIAWLNDFQRVGAGTLLMIGLLAVLAQLLDLIATAEGARRFGAGRAAMLGATLGAVVGLFFGLPGLILGPFIGAVLGHRLGRADLKSSLRAGVGASLGVAVATVGKVVLALLMLLWFGLAWWLD